jgi:hypothetical protein
MDPRRRSSETGWCRGRTCHSAVSATEEQKLSGVNRGLGAGEGERHTAGGARGVFAGTGRGYGSARALCGRGEVVRGKGALHGGKCGDETLFAL